MSYILNMWNKVESKPLGKWLFTRAVTGKAPYFKTINPRFDVFKKGHVEVVFKKRKAVHNHIQTVHAIAMCNAAELAGGTMMEASISKGMRWIPAGMNVRYLAKAETDLRAIAKVDNCDWTEAQEVPVDVAIVDTNGTEVMHAVIQMYVSPKSK